MARILVIGNDEGMRSLLRDMLEEEKHEVWEAPDGRVGIDLYRQHHPDLVVTDIFMPEQEGMQTILELRKKTSQVKIIAISGGALSEGLKVLRAAGDFGALRVLAKPFLPQDMLKAVKELLT